MDPSSAPPRIERPAPWIAAGILSLIPLWFALLALATRFNHDESQYVAGAYFAARLTIFRDYLYLQPPLHAWAFAPLALIFPAHILLAMRLATAALAVATLAALWGAQRIAGISRRSALTATMLVAATAAFQFAAGVVRNDMLPTCLSAMGMAALLLAQRRSAPARWMAAGLCLGLALSTKLNFAPLALAAGLFVLAHGGPGRLRRTAWLALGGGIGLLPALVAWANAPDAFLYGVLTYGATAPHAWFALNGAGHELAWSEKLVDLLRYMARGPALLGLLLTTICWIAARRRRGAPGRRLALWMTAGGLIGTALPTPAQLQYLMPLLPPLALSLGYMLDDARRWRQPRRRAMLALLCLSAMPGLSPSVRDLARMATRGSPVLGAAEDAKWAGRQIRALTGDDELVTLSPHLMIDSGLTLDPRLATGPFAYRTGWTVRPDRARRLHMLTPATLADLDRDPPEAILVGYEQGTVKLPANVDRALTLYAQRHGYRLLMMPDRIGRLYVRVKPEPARQASSRVGGLTRPANSLIPPP